MGAAACLYACVHFDRVLAMSVFFRSLLLDMFVVAAAAACLPAFVHFFLFFSACGPVALTEEGG